MDRAHTSRIAVIALLTLVAAACGNGTEPEPLERTGEALGFPDDVAFDVGVSPDPCPDAINPENGCIYLGTLSDLTQGPFAPLAVPITDGQAAFWQRVNLDGGIGGFDVDVETYTRDTLYDAQEHSARYREIEPRILALAQTLGTPTTEAILRDMDDDDVVAAPASWWSGWDFPETDRGLILNSGYSYCTEAIIGLDWHVGEHGDITRLAHVGYPGDYGGDSAVGATYWAESNGVELVATIDTLPNATVGTQDEAIRRILAADADLVVIAVGPAEAAEIIGSSVAQGYEGRFLGSVPTWNPALLGTASWPALEATYTHVAPWEPFGGESPAHDAIRASLGGELPDNDGYVFGWIWSYPILAALEAAVEAGDLTRAGLREVVDGLEVDYEGAVATRVFGGDPDATAVRTAVINVPDDAAQLGLRSIATGVTGPTADAFTYDEPCVS